VCFFCVYTAGRAPYYPAGVNPIHNEPADIDPGSLKVVQISKYVPSELIIHIKPKGVYGVETPPPKSFLVRIYIPRGRTTRFEFLWPPKKWCLLTCGYMYIYI